MIVVEHNCCKRVKVKNTARDADEVIIALGLATIWGVIKNINILILRNGAGIVWS